MRPLFILVYLLTPQLWLEGASASSSVFLYISTHFLGTWKPLTAEKEKPKAAEICRKRKKREEKVE